MSLPITVLCKSESDILLLLLSLITRTLTEGDTEHGQQLDRPCFRLLNFTWMWFNLRIKDILITYFYVLVTLWHVHFVWTLTVTWLQSCEVTSCEGSALENSLEALFMSSVQQSSDVSEGWYELLYLVNILYVWIKSQCLMFMSWSYRIHQNR